jgi:hypothetical protein
MKFDQNPPSGLTFRSRYDSMKFWLMMDNRWWKHYILLFTSKWQTIYDGDIGTTNAWFKTLCA